MIKRRHALIFALVLLAAVMILTFTGVFTVNLLKMNGSQLTLSAIIFVVSMGIGLVWKTILDYNRSDFEITWAEFLIGGAIVALVFSAIGVNIGWKLAWNNKVSYNEYWNGWELKAVQVVTDCTEDGSCYHTYQCHPYTVWENEDYECGTTDHPKTCSHLVAKTKYHSCPYVTQEITNTIKTTLGDYLIDSNIFTDNPVEWEWGSGIPGDVQRGSSQIWLDAKSRCDSGHPGPVTKRNSYDNYILASDTTIFREFSSQIDQYKAAKVLPDLEHSVKDFYHADKVYFVGYNPVDASLWQKAHSYLNAAFGTELQGDLHLVLVQNDYVSANPDAYIIALKAYWQSTEVWGKDAISKNTVIIVLGTTDGMTVSWARATTGMPIGNEAMIVMIQNGMKGISFTPEGILGSVSSEFYTKTYDDGSTKIKVRGVGETGALRRILWGMDDPATKFARVSMTANDAGDTGTGFNYLKNQIKPDFGQQLTIVIITLLLSCVVWFVDAYYIGEPRRYRRW